MHINTIEELRCITSKLVSSTKHRGRILVSAVRVGGVELPAAARLEPSESLMDVFELESATVPLSVSFWTGGADGRIMHASPLFKIPGIDITSWNIDLLHAWVLGPLGKYIGLALISFLDSGIFEPRVSHLLFEHRRELAIVHIKSLLGEHYQDMRREDPYWQTKHSQAVIQVRLYSRQ